jgi:phenylacetic acid degradation operon negative regulatory protein
VSPHRWEAEVREVIERLGIAEFTSLASTDDLEVGGQSEPRHIAADLWALDEIAARYVDFIDTYRDVPDQLEEMRRRGERIREADFLPGVLHIAIRFNQCFDRDPLLPPELLPRPWPGREARDVLARCRRLGVLAREDRSGPAMFQVFDDVIALLP